MFESGSIAEELELEIGTRMTVIRLGNGDLFLHSPVPLDDETCAALDALGPVGT